MRGNRSRGRVRCPDRCGLRPRPGTSRTMWRILLLRFERTGERRRCGRRRAGICSPNRSSFRCRRRKARPRWRVRRPDRWRRRSGRRPGRRRESVSRMCRRTEDLRAEPRLLLRRGSAASGAVHCGPSRSKRYTAPTSFQTSGSAAAAVAPRMETDSPKLFPAPAAPEPIRACSSQAAPL